MTARIEDRNGYWTISANPITKAGISEYSGAQIGADEPDRIYRVLKHPDELSKAETLKSFELLPLLDDHEMVGKGFKDTSEKPLYGVTGQDARFNDPYVDVTMTVYSENLQKKIIDGKVQLSLGYVCVYDFTPGIYEGQAYDAVQRNMFGNHIALVEEGRVGPDVRVLDARGGETRFMMDSMTLNLTEKGNDMSKKLLAALDAAKKAVKSGKKLAADEKELLKAFASDEAEEEKKSEDEEEKSEAEDEDEEKEKKSEDETEEEKKSEDETEEEAEDEDEEKEKTEDEEEEELGSMDARTRKAVHAYINRTVDRKMRSRKSVKSMDAATLYADMAARDKLAADLAPVIGVFDHSRMTAAQVAAYGAKKIGLDCGGVSALPVVQAFLKAVNLNKKPIFAAAQDARTRKSSIASKFKGETK